MRSHLVQNPSLACHFGDLEGALPFSACSCADLPTTLPSIPPIPHHRHPHLQNALPWTDVPSAAWVGTSVSSQLLQPRGVVLAMYWLGLSP